MTTIEFSTSIPATKEKVWETLWSEEGYRQWTAPFMEGSYAESDWKEGSKIRFLSPKGEGMYGTIQKLVPFEQMVFKHEGEIKKGMEEKSAWEGALEGYYLRENGGMTEVTVRLDTTEDFKEYFNNTFPKALEKLKEISTHA